MITYHKSIQDEARDYVEAALAGHLPDVLPDAAEYSIQLIAIKRMYERSAGDLEVFRQGVERLKQSDTQFANLLNPPQDAYSSINYESVHVEVIKNEQVCPPLPEHVRLPSELSKGVCPERDEYIRYSKLLSPEGYEGFHDSAFWWLLSTIAARRVYADFTSEQYTPLYIVFAATTSTAKSETAKVAKKVLGAAGLDWMLGYDRTTPQKLLSDMAGKYIPKEYNALPFEEKEVLKLRLAMSGQIGWINDEFGKFIKGVLDKNSTMKEYEGLFLTFDNCDPSFGNGTIIRGGEAIKFPYLALLGCMTLTSIRNNAKAGADLWNDGLWARCAIITPPSDFDIDAPFTLGKKPVPSSLSTPLQAWHQRLGMPEIDIKEVLDDKGKPTGDHEKIILTERKETGLQVSQDVYEAWSRYRSALKKILKTLPEDLHGSYKRFPAKAMRVATLIASLQGSNMITLRHWALAQEVTESWRISLHEFYTQVNSSITSNGPTIEEQIIEQVRKFHDKGAALVSARDLARVLHKNTMDLQPHLMYLARDGVLLQEEGRQKPKYRLASSL